MIVAIVADVLPSSPSVVTGHDTASIERRAVSDPPSSELALDASRLLRVRRGELGEPEPWSDAGFRRRVEAVVRDLGPIRSRASLAASYDREAHRGEPVRLAYAIRWLELGREVSAAMRRQDRATRTIRPDRRSR